MRALESHSHLSVVGQPLGFVLPRLLYLELIEEMDKELMKIIEDFNCAMNFEALHLANETSKHSLFQPVDS